jgi:hypothetical protein
MYRLKTETSMYWDPSFAETKLACRVGEHGVVAELRRMHDCGSEEIVRSLVKWVVIKVFGE